MKCCSSRSTPSWTPYGMHIVDKKLTPSIRDRIINSRRTVSRWTFSAGFIDWQIDRSVNRKQFSAKLFTRLKTLCDAAKFSRLNLSFCSSDQRSVDWQSGRWRHLRTRRYRRSTAMTSFMSHFARLWRSYWSPRFVTPFNWSLATPMTDRCRQGTAQNGWKIYWRRWYGNWRQTCLQVDSGQMRCKLQV